MKRHPLLGVDVLDASCSAVAPATKSVAKSVAKPAPARPAILVTKKTAPTAQKAGDPEVKQLQKLLAQTGYKPGPATGSMNDKTREAGYAFKRKYGLKAGTDNEETIEALQEVLAGTRKPPTPKVAASAAAPGVMAAASAAVPAAASAAVPAAAKAADPEIDELQTRLSAMGYNTGPATGVMNEQTREAAYAFKKANGLKAGSDAEDTIEVLKRLAGK